MVQDQLVEYINSQLKAGVSADAIKTALTGAGWQTADVDDTMKKVQAPQGASVAAVSAQPMAQAQSKAASSGGPQVIRVSDLVSPSSSAMGSSMGSGKTDAVMSRIAAGGKPAGAASMSPAMNSASPVKAKRSGALATESILGILMVLFAAAAIFLFFENQGLSSQVASVNSQSGTVSSQIATLQNQLDASTTALEAQIASLSTANSGLMLELSFYAVPPGGSATTTFTTALKGTVGGSKSSYVITTPDGAKVTVANSRDVRVQALLQPLVGTATSSPAMTTFAGNYVPGTPSITLTAVNGTSVTPPPAAATSTASTTTTGAPMIPATSSAAGQ